MLRLQTPLAPSYTDATEEELAARIKAAKEELGDRLFILGHHYQREDMIQFADVRGDSFKLAQWAAQRPEAEFIVDWRSVSSRKTRPPRGATACVILGVASFGAMLAARLSNAQNALRFVRQLRQLWCCLSVHARLLRSGATHAEFFYRKITNNRSSLADNSLLIGTSDLLDG